MRLPEPSVKGSVLNGKKNKKNATGSEFLTFRLDSFSKQKLNNFELPPFKVYKVFLTKQIVRIPIIHLQTNI